MNLLNLYSSAERYMRVFVLAIIVGLGGCAGTFRGCASLGAENFGADWVVVQMGYDGTPYRCWELRSTSIANEGDSDGIYWLSDAGHLVHISGHYNRVQVDGGRWDEALGELGLTRESCRAIQDRRVSIISTVSSPSPRTSLPYRPGPHDDIVVPEVAP